MDHYYSSTAPMSPRQAFDFALSGAEIHVDLQNLFRFRNNSNYVSRITHQACELSLHLLYQVVLPEFDARSERALWKGETW